VLTVHQIAYKHVYHWQVSQRPTESSPVLSTTVLSGLADMSKQHMSMAFIVHASSVTEIRKSAVLDKSVFNDNDDVQ